MVGITGQSVDSRPASIIPDRQFTLDFKIPAPFEPGVKLTGRVIDASANDIAVSAGLQLAWYKSS